MGIVSQLRQQHQQNTKTEKRKENSVVVVGEGGNPSVALTSGTWPIRAIRLLLVIQYFYAFLSWVVPVPNGSFSVAGKRHWVEVLKNLVYFFFFLF
jgi:hypothetical protein